MNKIKKSKKLFIIIFLTLLSFGLVEFVYAQTLPSDCWTQEQCLGQAGSETENYFFKVGDKAFQEHCQASEGAQYGKCYVKPEEVNLSVPIPDIQGGGTLQKVSHFSEYLKVLYTYFIYIIGIIAVAYIGWGGFEWMMAAGSAEKIGRAKETIQGAVIGLLLAVGSYVLLGAINSRLVNFDYIRVERIKPNFFMNYCVDTESVQKWIKVGDENKVKVNKEDTWCNFTYYSEINPGNTCQGLKCSDGFYCLTKLNTSGATNAGFECIDLNTISSRCMSQKTENCKLFDQYLQTVQKVSTNTDFANKACRLQTLVEQFIIEVGFTASNSCYLSEMYKESDYDQIKIFDVANDIFETYTMSRISCNQAPGICLDGGEPRELEWYKDIGLQVEVYCTDSHRASRNMDSICIRSEQSKCSVNKPFTQISDYHYVTGDDVYYDWVEVNCSSVPPLSGSCNDKCWVMMANYYDYDFDIL